MKKLGAVLAALMLFGVFGFVFASAATVAVDLAHGENDKYLTGDIIDKDTNETIAQGIIPTMTNVNWAYIGDPVQADVLGIKNLGDKITYDALKDVKVLIIGQPGSPFDPEEVEAIAKWFSEGGKVLWVAGDSDYGSGVQVQEYVDTLLEQLGVKLRLDLASVEDPNSNAGAGYRVVGIVNPDPNTPDAGMLTQGFTHGGKVLYHGPGVVAWVDENGDWHPLIDGQVPDNVYRIVKSSESGTIVENNDPPANAYLAGDEGVFTMLAAEFVDNNVLIVSGESPYGDYEPTWSPKYHGVELDGPQFVQNIINWAIMQTMPKMKVAVDLAHGENDKYLVGDVIDKETNKTLAQGIIPTLTNFEWGYFGDPAQADVLGIENLGDKITYDGLKGVDILIIGQPGSPFDPEEVEAIAKWFSEGGKVLWVAGDSDYGSGVQVQEYVDTLLEQLGVKLRLDLASVEDPNSNAGAGYRVVGIVNPDPNTPDAGMLTQGFTHGGKVLYHGPGVVAWVDENGDWHPLIDGQVPDNVYRIVKSSESGTIVENNDPPANAYLAGDEGVFTMLAAEFTGNGILVVSGESPYGDYEPTWSPKYHGVELDGPQFVSNMLRWLASQAAAMAPAEVLSDVAEVKDPEGDDHGPGTYTYPTNEVFSEKGLFDLTDFKIKEGSDKYVFELYFKNLGGNPWNAPNGFSLQIVELYLDFKEGGNTTAIKQAENGPGSNVALDPEHPWDVAIRVFGWGNTLLLPDGTTADVKVSADLNKNMIRIEVPKEYIKIDKDYGLYGAVLVGSQDGYGVDTWRVVAVDAEEWKLGGADANAVVAGVAPRVLDLLVPAGFSPTQEEQLKSYDAQNNKLAVVSMIPIIEGAAPTTTTTTTTSTTTTSTTPPSTTTVTTTVTQTTTTTTTTTQAGGGVCGPAAIIALALVPLLMRRRR